MDIESLYQAVVGDNSSHLETKWAESIASTLRIDIRRIKKPSVARGMITVVEYQIYFFLNRATWEPHDMQNSVGKESLPLKNTISHVMKSCGFQIAKNRLFS